MLLKASMNTHCTSVSQLLIVSLLVTANIKVKVQCNQTGKVFVSPVVRLLDDDCNQIPVHQLHEGDSVYWEDDDSDAYPVTVIKIIGEH